MFSKVKCGPEARGPRGSGQAAGSRQQADMWLCDAAKASWFWLLALFARDKG